MLTAEIKAGILLQTELKVLLKTLIKVLVCVSNIAIIWIQFTKGSLESSDAVDLRSLR